MLRQAAVERLVGRVGQAAGSTSPPVLALGLACVIAALGVVGYLEDMRSSLSLFDLDGEGNLPAAFSALLLGSAGVLSGVLHVLERRRRRWLFLGGFFLFMAVDEALTLHETAAGLTGVEWPVLYLPVMLTGGAAWLLVLKVLVDRGGRGCVVAWCAGAVAWSLAVLLEVAQSDPETGRVEAYSLLVTVEESLEMTGDALWLLTLLVVLRSVVPSRDRSSTAGVTAR